MARQLFPAIAFIVLLSSCTTFKPLSFSNNQQATHEASTTPKTKFIEEISMTPEIVVDKTTAKPAPAAAVTTRGLSFNETPAEKQEEEQQFSRDMASRTAEVEMASSVQLKYSVLLNTEVEYLPSKSLLENVDEWYGVRYRKGGTSKTGVDCSGFTVAVYCAVYGILLPRVSREQYRISRKISTTELEEGDLVFFNTNGSGVSHVGVYLGNNKFIHASVSKGIMVNSLFEPYYLKRFIGAGRIDDKELVSN